MKINYIIFEPIGNFVPAMANKATTWNPAGEAVKIAVDDSSFQSLIEQG